MSVMVVEGIDDGAWVVHLAAALPHFDVCHVTAEVDPDSVTHVAMWRLPAQRLMAYTNLEAILMLGAGYDHLELSSLLGIVRIVGRPGFPPGDIHLRTSSNQLPSLGCIES